MKTDEELLSEHALDLDYYRILRIACKYRNEKIADMVNKKRWGMHLVSLRDVAKAIEEAYEGVAEKEGKTKAQMLVEMRRQLPEKLRVMPPRAASAAVAPTTTAAEASSAKSPLESPGTPCSDRKRVQSVGSDGSDNQTWPVERGAQPQKVWKGDSVDQPPSKRRRTRGRSKARDQRHDSAATVPTDGDGENRIESQTRRGFKVKALRYNDEHKSSSDSLDFDAESTPL